VKDNNKVECYFKMGLCTKMAIRVLMVDDDPVHLELSERFLKRQSSDYEVISIETPEQALKLLLEEKLDAAICDIDLGEDKPTGLDILEQVRVNKKDIPVIIFTGKSREEFAIQALNLGADYYIRKSSSQVEDLYAELSYYILTSVRKRRTERALVESERRLRESEAKLAEAQRIAHLGHWDWNIIEDNIAWSDEIYRIFGLAPQEFEATYEAFLNSVHQDDREFVRDSVDKAIHENQKYSIDHRVVHQDGTIRFVHEEAEVTFDEDGKAARMMGTVQDITTRVEQEKLLLESRESYKELYNNALVGLFRVRISDGMILECNDQFAKSFGFEKNDSSSFINNILTKHEDWDELKNKLGEDQSYITELPVTTRAGEHRWMRFSLNLWSEKDYIEGVMADITEQKDAVEMLKKQKEELSDFAHSMRHDLKNIFQNMLGFIELIEEEQNFSLLSRLRSLLHETGEMVDHSVALADAGLIVEETMNVDLTPLVREVADSIIPESVSYSQDQLPVVSADQRKVAQIFRNLFDNAIQHGQPSKIEVTTRKTDGAYQIRVANDGEAIPEPRRSKIFLRGFTTSKNGQGYGLAIIRRLVEAHGWTIKLLEDRETTFEIEIPVI
jgi:PAS domain S-box-containing protein